jgi:hypothetical protein
MHAKRVLSADTAILECLFDFGGSAMPALAADIVAAADDL